MVADNRDNGARMHKLIVRFIRIKIKDRAAGGIPAVNSVYRRAFGRFRNRLVPVAVIHAGERACLIHNAADAVRKRGMRNTVQHDRANRYLPFITLAPCLGGNDLGKQLHI